MHVTELQVSNSNSKILKLLTYPILLNISTLYTYKLFKQKFVN